MVCRRCPVLGHCRFDGDGPPAGAHAPLQPQSGNHPLKIDSDTDEDDVDEVLMVDPPPPPAHDRDTIPAPATSPAPSSPTFPPPPPPPPPLPILPAQPPQLASPTLLLQLFPNVFVSPGESAPSKNPCLNCFNTDTAPPQPSVKNDPPSKMLACRKRAFRMPRWTESNRGRSTQSRRSMTPSPRCRRDRHSKLRREGQSRSRRSSPHPVRSTITTSTSCRDSAPSVTKLMDVAWKKISCIPTANRWCCSPRETPSRRPTSQASAPTASYRSINWLVLTPAAWYRSIGSSQAPAWYRSIACYRGSSRFLFGNHETKGKRRA
jgi:hypothetical protein